MSIDRMFHNVEPTLRLAIAKHEVKPEHIWKLDSQAKERAKTRSFEIEDNGVWTTKEKAASSKDYPNRRSLFDPLIRYFSMLQIFVAQSAGVNSAVQVIYATGEYMRQLENIAHKYEWDAVLRYHFEFHSVRLADMRAGDYSGWAVFDRNLGGQYLDGRTKASSASKSSSSSNSRSSQTCFAFQSGKCPSPCAQGRLHRCRICKGESHGSNSCPDKKTPA
jgi:hypothetical protein